MPSKDQPWPRILSSLQNTDQDDDSCEIITAYTEGKAWHWPGKTVFFFCDLHADVDAFRLSLLASGGVSFQDNTTGSLRLTEIGREALFVIGGDCFDKGPSTLALLDLIYNLKAEGANVHLLAGNHDVRTYLGLFYAARKEPLLDHLFIRMGSKAVPFLKELVDKFVASTDVSDPSQEAKLREDFLPSPEWEVSFKNVAEASVHPKKLEKELKRTKEKTLQLLTELESIGLSFCEIAAAIEVFKEMFVNPKGQYYWFFDSMGVAHREGSYLYVHAGLDDSIAELIKNEGIDELNKRFHTCFYDDPFELYHGALGNTFRTKYRESDIAFTSEGAKALHDADIFAIVHGHRNICNGQRIVIRENMLNFECDASVDRNTREKEGLEGPGGAVVIFKQDGTVKGISTDYPFIKSFNPS